MKILKTVKKIKSKEGKLHFRRFAILAFKKWGLYIHIFSQPDKEKHEHDHPWDFTTMVLYGGYVEQHKGKYYNRLVFKRRKVKAKHTHRIHKLYYKKCITLVLIKKRKRDWGYITEEGWVEHKEYRKLKKDGKF